MTFRALAALLIGASSAWHLQNQSAFIRPSEVGTFVGARKIVCGDVAGIRGPASGRDPMSLDLERPFPNEALAVVISSGDREKLGLAAERSLLHWRLCVEGKIEARDGHFQIKR